MHSRLARVFARHPEVRAVYLFGSRDQGTARTESDYDLAVLFEGNFGEVYLDLLAELVDAGFERVDLVDLSRASPALKFAAVRGELLYRRADFDPASFFSRVAREYWDQEPFYRRVEEGLKRRWSAPKF